MKTSLLLLGLVLTAAESCDQRVSEKRVAANTEIELTEDSGSDDWGPTASPDGSTIAFYSSRGGNSAGRIFLMNPDGSDLREVNYPNTGGHDIEPYWTKDGSEIIFTVQTNYDDQGGVSSSIYRMKSDGSNMKEIYDHDGPDGDGATHFGSLNESGDGMYFFYWPHDAFRPNLYFINFDKTGLKQLTSDSTNYRPEFGMNKILFGSLRTGDHKEYLMDLKTNDVSSVSEIMGTEYGFGTIRSDGFYFVQQDTTQGTTTFFKSEDFSSSKPLATIDHHIAYFFSVSPSSAYILYNKMGPKNHDIFRLDLNTGKTRALLEDL
ncbi:MAG: DUF5050 domain-containing protein [bacterium]|nr:DUF5050 domain-containing protein [bacterium]